MWTKAIGNRHAPGGGGRFVRGQHCREGGEGRKTEAQGGVFRQKRRPTKEDAKVMAKGGLFRRQPARGARG